MNSPESYYLGALKSALEGNLAGALDLQEKAEEARETFGYSFAEPASDEFPFIEEALNALLTSYDFARCVRPDGSAYGTRGKCKKGTEQAKAAGPTSGIPTKHKEALSSLEDLHDRALKPNEHRTLQQKINYDRKKILENEADLMRKTPGVAKEILDSASRKAENARVREKRVEETLKGYAKGRSKAAKDMAWMASHVVARHASEAKFHEERAEQAKKALGEG